MSICDPGARVDSGGLAFKGSMLQLQLYVNRFTSHLNSGISEALRISGSINWVSPLEPDRYAEYRDDSFLEILGLEEHANDLASFWPRGGPCWDGLGLVEAENGRSPVLVEAKSYPKEGYSSMSAKSPTSRAMIERALGVTSAWVGLKERPSSWTDGRYQVANRLAHLFFLREVLGLQAFLVFLFIVDDPTHNPTSAEEWEEATSLIWREMNLAATPPNTGVVYMPGVRRDPQLPV